ncbi:unnamed protein product [Trifolium pratense]|uniref:Uncharacterized protein n=1 Tax=Trifolium pratense TaxID=57577 RepID=A0ACB0J8D8_TRIPR|nr:unnamed protein product [Trifolium pratense]
MGEEEKKTEETKTEEPKTEEETKPEEKPEEPKDEAAPPPPPPSEIVLKVFMHCEGCARKVRRSLKDFPGVEDVITDCKSHTVVVKGEKADPLKVVERIQKKSHRKVEILSPIPNPPEEEKIVEEEKPAPAEDKKEEAQIVSVVLKVHMHCEACALEMKKRILKMKGVESVETDLKNSEVSVKGMYDPARLVEYMYKRFGKHSVIVKEEKAEEEAKPEEEKKEETVEEVKAEEEKKGEEETEAKPQDEGAAAIEEETKVEDELKKIEYYYNPPMDLYAYPAAAMAYPAYPPAYYQAYPPPAPQMFSDENPNACSVM